MKELSIEEKAKRYDGNYKTYTELINRLEGVKDAIKKQNYGIAMDILCKHYTDYQIITSTELKESEDDKELSEILGRVIRRYINDPNIPYAEREKVSMEIIPYVERLEKKSEQKLVEMKSAEESLGVDSDTYNKIVDECIFGEQKPTDKVEPKFKEE